MEMSIGANIKRLRMKENITQEQLSIAMNVTCAAVSKWQTYRTFEKSGLQSCIRQI